MRRFTAAVLLALGWCLCASAMPLGLRSAMWSQAVVGPGGGEEPGGGEVPEGGESKFDVTLIYDGEGHAVDTNALAAAFAAAIGEESSVEYALEAAGGGAPAMPWTAKPPVFTNAGEHVVWYRVTNPNYEEFIHAAKVTIGRRAVTLTSGSSSKMYDGTALTEHSVVVGGDGFVDGEGAVATYTGSQTDVGSSENLFAYELNDGTKADNYAIVAVYGTLTVTKAACITFDTNGGKSAEAKRTVEAGAAVGSLPTPTKTGYAFAGWWTAKSGGVEITADTAVTEDATYYTRWTANKYTVKFYANGGKGTMKTISATYGNSVKLTANAFKRTGYKFVGWAKSKSGAVAYKDKASVKNLTAVNGKAVAFYAVWKPCSYKIKFDKNGGKGTMKTLSATYGKNVKLTANAFKRTGYKFAGWAKKKNGKVAYKNKAKVKNLTDKDGKTVTLYAVWKKAKSSSVKPAANVSAVAKSASVASSAPADKSATVPAWAVGTFYGGDGDALSTITVSKTGKVSGKVLFADGSRWTIVGKASGQRIAAVVTDASGVSTSIDFVITRTSDGRCSIDSADGSISAEN